MMLKTQIILLFVAVALALMLTYIQAHTINHEIIEIDQHPIDGYLKEGTKILSKRDTDSKPDGEEETKKPKKKKVGKKPTSTTTKSPSKSTTKHPGTTTKHPGKTTKHPGSTTKHPGSTTKHPGSTGKPSDTTTTGKPGSGDSTSTTKSSSSRKFVKSSGKSGRGSNGIDKLEEEKSAIEYAIAGLRSWRRFYEKNHRILNRHLAGEFLLSIQQLQQDLGDENENLIQRYTAPGIGFGNYDDDGDDAEDDDDEMVPII